MDATLRRALWEVIRPLLQLISNLINPEVGEEWTREFGKFVAKRPCWVPEKEQAKPAPIALPTSPAIIDPIVRVNRKLRSTYPDWAKLVMHPELEALGPAEFDATKLEQYLHKKQESGRIGGHDLYRHLKSKKLLEGCLGLADLVGTQQKGIVFFRQNFAGKAVFGWKSVVRSAGGDLSVPYLFERGEQVIVDWHRLDCDWGSGHPALRFVSQR